MCWYADGLCAISLGDESFIGGHSPSGIKRVEDLQNASIFKNYEAACLALTGGEFGALHDAYIVAVQEVPRGPITRRFAEEII
jgi:hypothetical protein